MSAWRGEKLMRSIERIYGAHATQDVLDTFVKQASKEVKGGKDADAKMLWAGRIKSWSDNGDGWIAIQCVSVDEILTSSVWLDQWEGTLRDRIVIDDKTAGLVMSQASGSTNWETRTTLDDSSTFSTDFTSINTAVQLSLLPASTSQLQAPCSALAQKT